MKHLKLIVIIITILIVVIGIGSISFYYRMYLANRWQERINLPAIASLQSEKRILIFAPHCDDETLGTGGIIIYAVKMGAAIRVVEMTNGDGFHSAAVREFKKINPSAEDYEKLAYIRQAETIEALKALGVKKPDVIFLGYPDKGLSPMWTTNWDKSNLYLSKFINKTHSPYSNSYTKDAPFCGSGVLTDVMDLIEKFKPSDIYIPHPNDEHTDHWATNCFIRTAIEKIEMRNDKLRGIVLHTYLVHRGEWPTPMGYNSRLKLCPPSLLSNLGTRWVSLSLQSDAIKSKYAAVMKFKSQTAVMKRFLLSFVRKNDLYGFSPPAQSFKTENNAICMDGNTYDWHDAMPVIEDPVKDNIRRDLNGYADIKAIYVADDNNYIYIRADYRNRVSNRVKYDFFIHSIANGSPDKDKNLNITIIPGKSAAEIPNSYAWKDKIIELKIDKRKLGNPTEIIVGASTFVGKLNIDKAAFQLVSLKGKS